MNDTKKKSPEQSLARRKKNCYILIVSSDQGNTERLKFNECTGNKTKELALIG